MADRVKQRNTAVKDVRFEYLLASIDIVNFTFAEAELIGDELYTNPYRVPFYPPPCSSPSNLEIA
jgi:hypothetical protein